MASQKVIQNQGERTRCEVWTRVMGYFRPVSFFNEGKKSEHYSRKHFQECVAANNSFSDKYAD
jgi:anaerobic ribonucleoside-triphosphate reductase